MVFKPVSSMKTRRWLSQRGWSRRQRIRAALTSGRSCSAACVVFFITQAHPIKSMPQGGDPDLDPQLLPAALLQFRQGQIGLPGDPPAQGPLMRAQPRPAIAPDLFGPAVPHQTMLLPKPLHTFPTDPEALTNLPGASTAFARGNDARTQIFAQRPHDEILMHLTLRQLSVCGYLNRKRSSGAKDAERRRSPPTATRHTSLVTRHSSAGIVFPHRIC